jgi:hypothetical protein
LNYAYEAFRKHDWRTDIINSFVPGDSVAYLGNDLKNYEADIVGVTMGYHFKYGTLRSRSPRRRMVPFASPRGE